MKTTYLFFPVATSPEQQLFNIVSSGYVVSATSLTVDMSLVYKHQAPKATVTKVYYECVRYEEGHFDKVLESFRLLKGKALVEIPKAKMIQPQALELFSNVLSDGQTVADIRIVAPQK
jgi:hypothetical protein